MKGNTVKRIICILLSYFVLVSTGCVPQLPRYDFHSVVVVLTPSLSGGQLKGMPSGKGEGAVRLAGSAMGGLWSGCGQALSSGGGGGGGGGGGIVLAFMFIGAVCAGLTPIAGVGGAIVGAYKADPASKVKEVVRSIGDNIPDDREAMVLFERTMFDPPQKEEGRAFRIGRDYGLQDLRPDGDYRPLAEQGIDAVLDVGGLIVTLNGKDLRSPLSLEICTPLKLISTADNAVLFADIRCRTHGTRKLDDWSADQWSLLKTEALTGIQELGQDLYDIVFLESRFPGLPPVEEKVPAESGATAGW